MSSKMLYAAETWDRVYKAFENVNFTSYDYDAVKQSLLDYLKLNYSESFNDYIESSQLIALIEVFAYIAEQQAYRIDMSVHENMLATAQRKQSILRLAKMISYTSSRNLPLRGLVKVTSISTSEDVRDSQGNSLANKSILWADPSNPLWKEQFFLINNHVTSNPFGSPLKSFQVDDVVFQQYETLNLLDAEIQGTSFHNGVLPLSVQLNNNKLAFEIVPSDIDANGVFERSPNPKSHFTMLYANDGFGDTSDMTGFMFYIKEGKLQKLNYTFDSKIPNRSIDINQFGINDVDVWLQEVSANEDIIAEWEAVDNINGINLAYNNIKNTKKFEIETLENDAVRLVFGSGDFSDIPTGYFNIWVRTSNSGGLTLSKEDISNQTITFAYTSKQGKQESCTFTVSLVSALQNSADSEDIEHIRNVAPSVYYTQDRMVNGQDYNSYLLKDSSVLKLKAVNRTFAGQPKYLNWNDASGTYQNVKLFGDDLRMYYDVSSSASTSKVSARSLINDVIEPALTDPGLYNLLAYAFYGSGSPLNSAYVRPRVKFIEDPSLTINDVPIMEKTELQGALDRHWYGEPDSLVLLGPDLSSTSSPLKYYGVVDSDVDRKIYDASLKLVTKNLLGGYTLSSLPNAVSGLQEVVSRQRRFGIRFNPDRAFGSNLQIGSASTTSFTTLSNISNSDVVQTLNEETITVEIIDSVTGTFTVVGSKSGIHATGIVGAPYSNGIISFNLGFPPIVSTSFVTGDAFIIKLVLVSSVLTPSVYKKNLLGRFEIIDETFLPSDIETLPYNVTDNVASWVMLIERNDAQDGSLDYWRIVTRNFKLVVESPTTQFFFNKNLTIIDPTSKTKVSDTIKVLKSNLDVTGTKALGIDQSYFVVDNIRYSTGDINSKALQISPNVITNGYMPSDGRPQASLQYLEFIGQTNYVYFQKDIVTGILTPITTTNYLSSLTYINGVSGNYIRKLGRELLDFAWVHYTGNDNLVDPSTSNIIDMYLLTRGFYSRMVDYLQGRLTVAPIPPTPFELRSSYKGLLENKMISDTVVLNPAKVKLLFGGKAIPELRAKFKLVKNIGSKLTDDQLRVKVLDIINLYFNISEWDFGKAFYAQELCAVTHKQLPLDLSSVVIVPEFPSNYFGDLLYVQSDANEVLMTAAELKDIQVITSLDRITLRQK
jgi:hypothetical protein